MNRAHVVALTAAINRLSEVILMSKFGEYVEANYLTKPDMEQDYLRAAERQVDSAEKQFSDTPYRP